MYICQKPRLTVWLLLLLATGCAGDKERLVLEDRLREKDATIRDLEKRVAKTEQLLADQDQELVAMRLPEDRSSKADFDGIHTVSSTVETSAAWGSVKSIAIHRMTSGVVLGDGSKRINVVIQPLDEDLELVKVSGQLKLTASTVNKTGVPEVIASREVDITESRQLWTRSLVSSGFHVELTTSRELTSDTPLLLSAVLNLGQGRSFKTTELVGK